MRRRTRNQWSRLWFVGTALVLGCASSAVAASSGLCVKASVPSPILLPDGRIAPAGELTLCDTVEFSPVTSLHKAYVNGVPFGMLKSHKRASEGPVGASPKVLFRTDGEGNLELVGYVVPTGRTATAYVLTREESVRNAAGSASLAVR